MKRFCWHKWKEVRESIQAYFLGREIEKEELRYRICLKCLKAQELFLREPKTWKDLTKVETEILIESVVDKGDYYLLKRNKEGC